MLADVALAQPQPQQRPARPAPSRPPAIVTEPLPPIPAPQPTPPEPVQRRVALPELGLPAGLAFDTAGREMSVNLPRELAISGARLSFTVEVAAPYGGRQAVEVSVNGRLLGALAFNEASTRLAFEAAVPPEDLARAPEALRIGLRLVEAAGGGARATLLPSSYIAVPLSMPPSLGALSSFLPPRILVLVAPGAVPAADAAMALRVALALAETGRQVWIGTGTPAAPVRVGGQRVWETGTVVIGASVNGAEVRTIADVPVLLLGGGPEAEHSAGLPGTAQGAPGQRDAATLPFRALHGTLGPQDAPRAAWNLGFSTRDLPPGTTPSTLEIALHAPPNSRANASVMLNEVVLGAMAIPADGRARLNLPIPPQLLAFDNRIDVTLHRQDGPGGPAQLLPDSVIRLSAAGPAREFLDLPPRFAAGVEVILDAPGGMLPAESLMPALWLLRRLAPPGSPIRVTLQDPATPARPTGAFLALTGLAPEGTTPPLRFEPGRMALAEARGLAVLALGGIERVWSAQLLTVGGQAGLWLRAPATPPALSATPPALDRGDVALLDGRGVALAWRAAPLPASPPMATPAAATSAGRSAVLIWRPWMVGALWFAGLVLVAYALLNPRREWRPARPSPGSHTPT